MPDQNSAMHALVVDDEPAVRRILASALKRVGFTCHTAPDGELGLQAIVRQPIELLVTDLRMPNKHGHRLVVDVFDQVHPPMIVVITAVTEFAIVADLLKRGVADVVLKPFDSGFCAAKWKAMVDRQRETASQSQLSVPSEEELVTSKISEATNTLRKQLKEISASFEDTIKDLESKQEKLEAGFLGSVRLLTQLLRQFDDTDTNHAGRVEKLVRIICKEVNLTGDALRDVLVASLLHDLGQFGMPDAVRGLPPWELSETQREAFTKYPEIGATLLSEVPGCDEIVRLVSAHAECFDGSGFPNHLRGTDIPLGARIIRLADGADTYLMYHKGGTPAESLAAYLRSERGRTFDPRIVDAAYDALIEHASNIHESQSKISHITPGDVLAHDLFSTEGSLLARQGASVTEAMRVRLLAHLGDVTIRVVRQQNVSVE
ncbi:MAG: hypothetical protein AMXMBFR84_33330 [Candidatus Hydrogenedentota bacterium]